MKKFFFKEKEIASSPPLAFCTNFPPDSIGEHKQDDFFNEITEEVLPEESVTVKADKPENNVPNEMDALVKLDKTTVKSPSNLTVIKNIAISGTIGIGTGIGMMPIFNYYLKKSPIFGFDLHGNEIIFALSTANTFIIYGFNSSTEMYQFLNDNHEEIRGFSKGKKLGIAAAKVGAACSTIFPIALLWHIELTNQKVSGSEGFDEFMGWATAATLPIFFDRVLAASNAVDYINSNQNMNLTSFGSKLFTYGISLLGSGGRIASYSSIGYQLALDMGAPHTEAIIFGVVFAGIMGSGGVNLFQYQKLKTLFQEDNSSLTLKEGVIGAVAVAEGIWLSFPLVSAGLELMSNVNAGIQAAILAPMFVSNMITESQLTYTSIDNSINWISKKCCGVIGEDNTDNYDYGNTTTEETII